MLKSHNGALLTFSFVKSFQGNLFRFIIILRSMDLMNQVTHTRVRSTLSTFVLTFNGHKSKKRFRSNFFMHCFAEICRIIDKYYLQNRINAVEH